MKKEGIVGSAMIRRRDLMKCTMALSVPALSKASADNFAAPRRILVPSNAWVSSASTARLDIRSANPFYYTGAAWRSDSKRIVVTTIGYAAVYDAYSGTEVVRLPRGGEASKNGSIRYLDGTNVIVRGGPLFGQPSDTSIAITLADGDTGTLLRQVDGYINTNLLGAADGCAPSGDVLYDTESGRIVISPVGVNEIQSFSIKDWTCRREPLLGFSPGRIALRPRTNELAVVSLGKARIYNRRDGNLIKALVPQGAFDVAKPGIFIPNPGGVSFSPNGSTLLVSHVLNNWQDSHFQVYAWRCTDYDKSYLVGKPNYGSWGVAFHPDGAIFAVGTDRKGVYFYDTATLELRKRISFSPNELGILSFSPDGSSLIAGSPAEMLIIRPDV
jgi:WD40 repeat protein